MYIIHGIAYLALYFLTLKILEPSFYKIRRLPELKRSLNVLIGISENGKQVYHDFRKHTHMIVAGTTGYGKTNFIKCLISQLQGEVILVDLKGGFDYGKVTATNISEAREALREVVDNMRGRRKKHIFVIVDEAGELLPPRHLTRKESWEYLECLSCVSEIARLGRGFNVHLIYCTQYPTRDILDGQVKQNAESRVVFRLPTEIASRVALDEGGAELLESGKFGVAIYKKDFTCKVMTYLFEEREDWDASIREKKIERSGDFIVLE